MRNEHDLIVDVAGEITRIGRPRQLLEGTFEYSTGHAVVPALAIAAGTGSVRVPGLWLHNGIQILSYSLVTAREFSAVEILQRATPIESAPIPYDPSVDLVGGDLAMTPAIIKAIENGTI